MILKAGTYRFNEVVILSQELNSISQNINFTLDIDYEGNKALATCNQIRIYGTGIMGDGSGQEWYKMSVNILSLEPDLLASFGVTYPYNTAIYSYYVEEGEASWYFGNSPMTILTDTEVDDTFGTWYIANTNYNEVNATPLATIEYNGQVIASLNAGETATLSCEGKKMVSDLSVKVESGYVKPSGSVTVTENSTVDVTELSEVVVDVPNQVISGSRGLSPEGIIRPSVPFDNGINFTLDYGDDNHKRARAECVRIKTTPIGNGYDVVCYKSDGTVIHFLDTYWYDDNGEFHMPILRFGLIPQLVSTSCWNFLLENTWEMTSEDSRPVKVYVESGMMTLLETATIGSVYKYTGTSGTYENGALYIVEGNLITFSIYGFVPFEAEEGMTWGEFINSEYNPIGNYSRTFHISNDYVMYGNSFVTQGGGYCSPTDKIIANGVYNI